MPLIGWYIKYNVRVRSSMFMCDGVTTDFRRPIFTSDGSHNHCNIISVNLEQQSDISCDRFVLFCLLEFNVSLSQ